MTNPFGVYLHVPYCIHRCSYCDFFSSAKFEPSDFNRVAEALHQELESALAFFHREQRIPGPMTSVFFGGGTPSLMPLPLLKGLAKKVLASFPQGSDLEVTLEANPETVSLERVLAWKEMGVNRVSMGAQSFNPELLKTLERLATPESIVRAVGFLKEGGISDFNLDLIFGIPGQDLDGMLRDLEAAVALGPRHISSYNLTLKPGHALYHRLPSDDESADLYEAAIEFLGNKGFPQYEISNYARDGAHSKHNLLYWNGGDYLGVGPSSASRFFWNGTFHHRKQLSDMERYLATPHFPDPGFEVTTPAQTALEAVFLELRKNEGISLSHFASRYQVDLTAAKKFNLFVKEGLLRRDADRLSLTSRGRLLADTVTRDLVD